MIHHIPTADIAETALSRDRLTLEAEPLDELKASILRSGLRQPVEVFPIEGDTPFALLSGFRRLAAVRALAELLPGDRFATIPAFIRQPDGLAEALRAMVEENEIRQDISPFERGLVAVRAMEQGVFPTLDAAVAALYPHASAAKRSRLRSLAAVAERLEGVLKYPESLSLAQGIRLANALRQDFGDIIEAALLAAKRGGPGDEWAAMLPYMEEAEDSLRTAPPDRRPGRPRRQLALSNGIRIRRERVVNGWVLRFSGREATGDLMDLVMDEIERMFQMG